MLLIRSYYNLKKKANLGPCLQSLKERGFIINHHSLSSFTICWRTVLIFMKILLSQNHDGVVNSIELML